MLGDNDEEIRMRGVNKVLSIRGNLPSTVSFDNHDLVDSRSEEYSLEGAKYYDTASTVRLFEPPHTGSNSELVLQDGEFKHLAISSLR